MFISSRFAAIASGSVLAAALAACAPYQTQPVGSGPAPYPASYPATSQYPTTAPAGVEYGRVTNIEYVQAGTTSTTSTTNPQVRNAVVGGIIGAVVGNVVGKNVDNGHSRTGATVLGAAGGAAIGSQVGRNETAAAPTNPAYRVTVQTDSGAWRTFEVSSTGDLRVGDRVRVENGVIYRS